MIKDTGAGQPHNTKDAGILYRPLETKINQYGIREEDYWATVEKSVNTLVNMGPAMATISTQQLKTIRPGLSTSIQWIDCGIAIQEIAMGNLPKDQTKQLVDKAISAISEHHSRENAKISNAIELMENGDSEALTRLQSNDYEMPKPTTINTPNLADQLNLERGVNIVQAGQGMGKTNESGRLTQQLFRDGKVNAVVVTAPSRALVVDAAPKFGATTHLREDGKTKSYSHFHNDPCKALCPHSLLKYYENKRLDRYALVLEEFEQQLVPRLWL